MARPPGFAPRVAGGALAWLLVVASCVSTAPALAAPSPDPATWRGDVRFLTAAIDSLHPRPYRAHSRAEWDSAASALERRLPSLRYHEAVAAFSAFVGLLGDGHSRLDQLRLAAHTRPTLAPLPGPGFGTRYPIECAVFADGLWITRAGKSYARLAGAKVVAIGGRPTADAVASLARLIPADNPMWALHVIPEYLRSPAYVSAAGLAGSPDTPLRLTVAGAPGERWEASVSPTAPDSAATWVEAAGAPGRLPLTRSLAGSMAFADLGDSARTVFARIRAIVDEPGHESVAAFTARLFAHVDSIGCRRLILDLRGNGGGNNYLNQPMVHAVLRRPAIDRSGGLFVIIDRGTFSAAVSLAADLERETHALFAGEPSGGAPDSPGDPADVVLPASGLKVRVATTMWNGSDPRDPRRCIFPDLPAMPTWAEDHAGRDVVLDAIAAWRATPGARDVPPNQHWGDPRQLHGELPRIAW
jgi:hypothetical protein